MEHTNQTSNKSEQTQDGKLKDQLSSDQRSSTFYSQKVNSSGQQGIRVDSQGNHLDSQGFKVDIQSNQLNSQGVKMDNSLEDYFTTFRDPTFRHDHWRTELNPTQLSDIEKFPDCQSAIEMMGYDFVVTWLNANVCWK